MSLEELTKKIIETSVNARGKFNPKKLKVSEMRKFIKGFKQAQGEKWTGGSKVGKPELATIMQPMLKDPMVDALVGGSIWTDFVKEFSAKHGLKYACALSKYKVQLSEAYKKFKANQDWYVPMKKESAVGTTQEEEKEVPLTKKQIEENRKRAEQQVREGNKALNRRAKKLYTGKGLVAGNKWTDFVKDYAKKNNTTYGCALSDLNIKGAYRLFKEGKEWFVPRPEPIATQTDDFEEPVPVKAPEDIKPVVNKIDEKIEKLKEVGAKKNAVSYNASSIIADVAFVNLISKYGGQCLISNTLSRGGENIDKVYMIDIGLKVNTNPQRSSFYGKPVIKNIAGQLKECIDRGVEIIAIPLTLRFGVANAGHANMLIYRPFKRVVDRFEPHGKRYGNSMIDDKNFNDQLKKLFEEDLTQYLGAIRYRNPDEVCPFARGFQSLENQLKGITNEGGGFCSMWSIFLMEMVFLNPDKSTTEIIQEVMSITKEEPQYLKDVIRGYVMQIENQLDELLQHVSQSRFKFGRTSYTMVKNVEDKLLDWISNVIFDTGKYKKAPPDFEPLPEVVVKEKGDVEKLKEVYMEKLKNLTIQELKNIYSMFGKIAKTKKKGDMIINIVDRFTNRDAMFKGATGVRDIDIILEEELYKGDKWKSIKRDYFIKKRDGLI